MTVSQIKSTFSSVGRLNPAISPATLVLSLSVTNYAIRYFIHVHTHTQVIFYGNYQLHHVENEGDLAQRLEKIVGNDEALQLAYYKVHIGINTPYTVSPAHIYFPETQEGSVALCSLFKDSKLALHFNLGFGIDFKLRQLFPRGEILHLNGAYLRFLPALIEENSDKLFVSIMASAFDVLRYNEGRQLQLMNRYQFSTRNDFIYFLLLCCEQLKIDRETTALVLMGEIDMQSEIYKMCYKYFRYISFIEPPAGVQFSRDFDDFPRHLHFNLYTLGL